MTPMLTLNLLGGVHLLHNNVPLPLPKSRKGLALFLYLACTGRAHRRESLATLLWDATPTAQALSNLRTVLSRLPAPFRTHLLLTEETVGVDPAAGLTVDVSLLEAALSALDRQSLTAAGAAQLANGLAGYQGDFLAGFSLRGASSFSEWMLQQRERLSQLARQGCQRLAAFYETNGDFGRALATVQQWLVLDDLDEAGHTQLIRLLALTNQRAAALAHFERWRERVAQEFGTPPADELLALIDEVRTGQIHPVATPHPVAPGNLHQLPQSATPFVGREAELQTLHIFLAEPTTRLITILGPGGIGKTRLAIALAMALGGQPATEQPFADGIYFVALEAVSSAEQLWALLAAMVGCPFTGAEGQSRTVQQQLYDYLAARRLLLILDNFEQMLAAGPQLLALLQAAPQVKLLITTRERLNVAGEQLLPLDGLAYPTTAIAAEDEFAALVLFTRCAQRIHPHFTIEGPLAAADREAVAAICRLVEGMPLALELAASRVETMAVTALHAELQQALDLAESDDPTLLPRHRSMRAVFALTWQRLTAAEQQHFAELAYFQGGFTRAAVQAVTQTPLRTLADLINKALVRYAHSRDRYSVHELLRYYGAEKLALDPDEAARLRQRHATYYSAYLAEQLQAIHAGQQQTALPSIEVDLGNVLLAWQWSLETRALVLLAQAVDGLGHFFELRGRAEEGRSLFAAAAGHFPVPAQLGDEAAAGAPPDPEAWQILHISLKVLAWQGVFDRLLVRTDQAHDRFAHCLACCAQPRLAKQDTRAVRAFVYLQDGLAYLVANRPRGAEQLRAALALLRALSSPWLAGRALMALGDIALWDRRYAAAHEAFTESLRTQRQLRDQQGMAYSLAALGFLAQLQGNGATAAQLRAESTAIRYALGDRRAIAEHLLNLGKTIIFVSQHQAAHDHLTEALGLFTELGDRKQQAEALLYRGITLTHLGAYVAGYEEAAKAAATIQQLGSAALREIALFIHAFAALAVGRYRETAALAAQGIALARTELAKAPSGWVVAMAGWGAYGQQQVMVARQYYLTALEDSLQQKSSLGIWMASSGLALLLLTAGEARLAIQAYAPLARRLAGDSQWWDATVGTHVDAAVIMLGDEGTALWAQGGARDVWQTATFLLTELAQLGWSTHQAK